MGKDTHKTTTGNIVREFSSGGVVYKKTKDQILWLVRKTSASGLYPKQYWMFAKGRIDDADGDRPGQMALGKIKADRKSLEEAAIREVREEAGVEAKIIEKVGTSIYSFTDAKVGKILKFVTFFLMEWVRDLPEGFDCETTEVKWLPYKEANKTLSFGGEKQILKKAKELLAPLA